MDATDVRALRAHIHGALAQRYGALLNVYKGELGFELIEPRVDEWGQAVFGRWGGWILGINEMIVNQRVVMWDEAEGGIDGLNVPAYGWCYPRGTAALNALMSFYPATMGEPAGYVKRAYAGTRRAGELANGQVIA